MRLKVIYFKGYDSSLYTYAYGKFRKFQLYYITLPVSQII